MDRLKLHRVGGATVVTIPDDVLDQLGLRAGDSLFLDREAGHIHLRPELSSADRDSAERMMRRYEGVLKRLAT